MIQIGVLGDSAYIEQIVADIQGLGAQAEVYGTFAFDTHNLLSGKQQALDTILDIITYSDAVIFVQTTENCMSYVQYAVRNGKHVLLQHVPTFSWEEMNQLVEMTKEGSGKYMANLEHRFSPCVSSFTLGEVDSELEEVQFACIKESTMQVAGADNLSMFLYEHVVKKLDVVSYLLQREVRTVHVSSVFDLYQQLRLLSVRAELSSGLSITADITITDELPHSRIEFYTQKQRITLQLSESITKTDPYSHSNFPDIKQGTSMFDFIEELPTVHNHGLPNKTSVGYFLECIMFDKPPICSFQDAAQCLEILVRLEKKINSAVAVQ